MRIDGLLHVNIRCSANDLPAIEKFYEEALGMPTVKYIPPGLKKRV
jgi:catechol 2,3-dioxygenase-like lactoylglutathione lyase family enzyme